MLVQFLEIILQALSATELDKKSVIFIVCSFHQWTVEGDEIL